MLVELGKEIQTKLVQKAVNKAGSERKLEEETNIPDTSINAYKKGNRRLTLKRFRQFISFLNLKEKEFTFVLVDPRSYRIAGGKAVYKKYLAENRFEEIHKKMRHSSSKRMKKWHSEMKKEHPEEYYKLQYSRFKKIAEYKLKTKKGEFVRNSLELEVADELFDLGLNYTYEEYVKGASLPYFPDFKIGNFIIECAMWKGFEKAYALSKKINDLKKVGYKVKVIIPQSLRRFYKPIENNIINIKELKDLMPL